MLLRVPESVVRAFEDLELDEGHARDELAGGGEIEPVRGGADDDQCGPLELREAFEGHPPLLLAGVREAEEDEVLRVLVRRARDRGPRAEPPSRDCDLVQTRRPACERDRLSEVRDLVLVARGRLRARLDESEVEPEGPEPDDGRALREGLDHRFVPPSVPAVREDEGARRLALRRPRDRPVNRRDEPLEADGFFVERSHADARRSDDRRGHHSCASKVRARERCIPGAATFSNPVVFGTYARGWSSGYDMSLPSS